LLRIDRYRMTKEKRNPKVTCYPDKNGCGGYSFPHRKGSKWCDHNEHLTTEMMQQREGYA
jgi:hypothetical protein